jgi:hypothetical protein
MTQLSVSIDTSGIDRALARMQEKLKGFDSQDLSDELIAWQEEDLRSESPYAHIDSPKEASTDIMTESAANATAQIETRMAKLMETKLAWEGPPVEKAHRASGERKRSGKPKAWLLWERNWITHRRPDFRKRYGPRWKKVLYATAVRRWPHHYPRG